MAPTAVPSTKTVSIAILGTLGDLFPYLAIAAELRSAGARVRIAAPPPFRARIEAERGEHVDYGVALDLDGADGLLPGMAGRGDGMRRWLEALVARAPQDVATIAGVLEDSDVLLTHPMAVTAVAAARLDPASRWVSSVLAPFSFASVDDPSELLGPRSGPPLSSLSRLAVRGLVRQAQRSTEAWFSPLLEMMRARGVPDPGHPLFEGQHSAELVLALFGSALASPAPDWPERVAQVGFCVRPSDPAPADLAGFLEGGSPPVAVTLGSAIALSTGTPFYEVARDAAIAAGRRVVLLAGHLTPRLMALRGPDCFLAEWAPHGALFPRCEAVVHHGGVGTVAEVLRSGKPSVVVPFGLDQFDNGARIERRGCALVADCARLGASLTRLLEDPSFRESAARQAALVSRDAGAAGAARALLAWCERKKA